MVAGITHTERSRFDEALAYFKMKAEQNAPGMVLRFRGKRVDEIVWSERDKIRLVLEYDKETTGVVSRCGNVTIFAPAMSAGAGANVPGSSAPSVFSPDYEPEEAAGSLDRLRTRGAQTREA